MRQDQSDLLLQIARIFTINIRPNPEDSSRELKGKSRHDSTL
jgi:hypothetical protein